MKEDLLCISVVASLIISTLVANISTASTMPIIFVEPPAITVRVDETFTVNITVTGIVISETVPVSNGLFGWEVWMTFDPSVLHAVDATEGPFLGDAASTYGYTTVFLKEIDNTDGFVKVGEAVMPKMPPDDPYPPEGATGSGVLAIINFTAIAEGKSDLHFFSTGLYTVKEDDALQIEHIATNGGVHVLPPPLPHEIRVSLDAPTLLAPGDSTLLNATVYNKGLNNETNIKLQLLINGNMVESVVVPELLVDSSYTLTHLWTPPAAGTYNVTVYALPVPGENVTTNNVAAELIMVTYPFIRPIEGQWANYRLYSFEDNRLTGSAEWNITYDHYISPYLINITWWFKYQWGYNETLWMVVNIMNRQVEGSDGQAAESDYWYFGWIETEITIGSTINLLDSNAIVIGSRIIQVEEYPIECWELQYYGYYGIEFLWYYDKVSGLLIGMESTADYYRMNVTLVATNIPIGVLPVASFIYTPSESVVGETLTFNATDSYDPDGESISCSWDFGDGTTGSGVTVAHAYAKAGTYTVTLTVTDEDGLTNTDTSAVTVSRTTLNIDVDVGSIHFRGEMAEFYVLVSSMGKPVDADISATLYYSNGTSHEELTDSVEHTAIGLYRVPYTMPLDAPAGTYALVVNASFLTLKGTSIGSFLLSPTLTSWNAWLLDVQGDIATIKTDVATIKVSLEAINAELEDIEEMLPFNNRKVGVIKTDIGTVWTDLSDIKAELIALDGKTAIINTNVGTLKTDTESIELRVTNAAGDTATISTTLGTIQGKVLSIQGDVATIETNIGVVEASLPPTKATPAGTSIEWTLLLLAAIAFIIAIAAVLLRKLKGTSRTKPTNPSTFFWP